MKFKISNLGIIDSAVIDLSKPFILFTGLNGTGKTYLSSALYSLISELDSSILFDLLNDNIQIQTDKSTNEGMDGRLDPDALYDYLVNFLKNNESIWQFMNIDDSPNNFNCELVTTREEWRSELKERSISFYTIVQKNSNSFDFSIRWRSSDEKPFAITSLLSLAFFNGVRNVRLFPAERNGIYTFSNELAQWRIKNPKDAAEFIYPKVITNELAFSMNLKQYSSKETASPYSDLADEIEQMILKGSLTLRSDGDIRFNTDKKTDLGLNICSSSVKTLSSLIFYLRYSAGTYNLLFFDEPEINLHPDNQILLARIFVKMINAGLRLVISTHSDYIIREINNMIMASELGDDAIVSQYGYDSTTSLSSSLFVPYLFEFNEKGRISVKPIEVDRYGFNMPSIDQAITRQNEVTDTFFDILKYDHPV